MKLTKIQDDFIQACNAFYIWSHYRDYKLDECNKSLYLGNMDNINGKKQLYFRIETDYTEVLLEIPITVGSDYSGSIVEYSNYESLYQEFGKLHALYKFYGGYSTFGLVIRLSKIRDTWRYNDLLEAIQSLKNDYPLYNEDHFTNYEMEVFQDDIHNWIIPDIRHNLPDEIEVNLTDETIEDYIYKVRDEGLIDPIYESPFSCYVEIDVITNYILEAIK